MVEQMTITTHSSDETRRLGKVLGQVLAAGDVLLLSGALGAGKTTFSKGVAVGLGIDAEVTSPTFTLVQEYSGKVPLIHMDLYRLYAENGEPDFASLAELGWEDYLEEDSVVLIEWPQAVMDSIPDALQIEVFAAPMPRVDERVFQCKATGERSWHLLDEWVKKWLF